MTSESSLLWSLLVLVAGLYMTVLVEAVSTDDDATILQKFKNSVQQGPNGLLGSWGSSADPCTWTGVNCTSSRVTSLTLQNGQLQGTVSDIAGLASLPMLKLLTLSGNNFSQGSISSLTWSTTSGSVCQLEYVDLSYNILQGNFTENGFGVCKGLQTLNLTDNELVGSIPVGMYTQLPSIKVIDLSYNHLTGTLPTEINCSSLQVLSLSSNDFNGAIPPGLGRCPQLTQIDLTKNNFTGGLPADLFTGNCSGAVCTGNVLRELNISLNNVNGSLPITGFCTPSLQILDLASNHLSGSIPAALWNCSSLVYLNLSNNGFAGDLHVPNFPNGSCALQHLDLSGNRNISGMFATPLVNQCLSLIDISLATNQFSGELPNSLRNLQNLERLFLGSNRFVGPFPSGILNCSKLQLLDLSSNHMSGEIPQNICPSSGSLLQELRLQDNFFNGSIPANWAGCLNLTSLDLSFNQLKGVIPSSLGNLTKLESLLLWNNMLGGNIPNELARLSRLKLLILNNNRLQGPIPPGLSNCSFLEWVSLGSNNLSGTIPPQIFSLTRLAILQLGNNFLTGTLPPYFPNTTNLFWIDLGVNNITGPIPTQIGRTAGPANGTFLGDSVGYIMNVGPGCSTGLGGLVELAGIRPDDLLSLHKCQTRLYSAQSTQFPWSEAPTVLYIDLSYNSFTGSIPEQIGDLTALQVLDLAHNNLSGWIPSNISQCSKLMAMDLSSNSVTGRIPEELTNLTSLSSLNLSNNKLYGPIPTGGQFSTFQAWVFEKNLCLCGPPLATACPPWPPTNLTGGAPVQSVSPGRGGMRSSYVVMIVFLAVAMGLALALMWVMWRSKCCCCCFGSRGSDPTCTESTFSVEKVWNEEDLAVKVNIVHAAPLTKNLTFGDLLVATSNFSPNCIVGVGGFGEVYRAELQDGTVIAVKKLIHYTCQGEREFDAEMEILRRIEHKNLVRLLGYCKVREDTRLLIYEYMSCGSLEHILHNQDLHPLDAFEEPRRLLWTDRKQIALDSARGLAFLHHGCNPHIIHRDFKSSNVLLNKQMEARVSDFGMAREIYTVDTHLSLSTLTGTPGYVPPEYYQSFRCTRQGDVYSYGVVLLELISGRRPTEKEEEFGDTNLVGWVKKKILENAPHDIFDPTLRHQGNDEELLQYVKVACACVEDSPSHRPTMLWVTANLKEISIDFQSSRCVPPFKHIPSLPHTVAVVLHHSTNHSSWLGQPMSVF